jgi:hypothetical protein
MATTHTQFSASVVGAEVLIFDLAKSAALRERKLQTVPPRGSQAFLEYHDV